MKFLYLDESGDLGFDFVNKSPSKYFTITIVAVDGMDYNRQLINGVKKTIHRKFRKGNKEVELKGNDVSIGIKKYFYNQVKDIPFKIYAITLDKVTFVSVLNCDKHRIYNLISRKTIDPIGFCNSLNQIKLIIDKSKRKMEILKFNNFIQSHLESKVSPRVIIDINHLRSNESNGIQACDLFSYGINQKYENNKLEWLEVFKDKIIMDDLLEGGDI